VLVSIGSSESLPRSGTMSGGRLYARPILVHRTSEIGSGFYPTPTANDYGSSQNGSNASRPSGGTPSLSTIVREGMYPTPLCSDAKSGPTKERKNGPQLRDVIQRFDPTTPPQDCTTTRPADDGANGSPATRMLNPAFVERLMGFPAGWSSVGEWSACDDLPLLATRPSPSKPPPP
jgi:hypothetical protein